jgi:hypothetical protein
MESRLVILLVHMLKWVYQPDQRSRSWRSTLIEQRQELMSLLAGGVLRNQAEAVLAAVYTRAVERASAATGVAAEAFPAPCPYSLEQLLDPSTPV